MPGRSPERPPWKGVLGATAQGPTEGAEAFLGRAAPARCSGDPVSPAFPTLPLSTLVRVRAAAGWQTSLHLPRGPQLWSLRCRWL